MTPLRLVACDCACHDSACVLCRDAGGHDQRCGGLGGALVAAVAGALVGFVIVRRVAS